MKIARYELSFKVAAVRKVIVDGQSISATAREVDVTVTTLRSWISKYSSQFNAANYLSEDNESLKKRIDEITSERETLKETLFILLKEQIKITKNSKV